MTALRIGVRFASMVDEFGELISLAVEAERLGFHHYEVGDHVLISGDFSAHPGERWDWGPEAIWPDPLVLLAGVATVTSTIRLGTAVLIAPLRPAIVLAKMAATLDVMSRGRLDLGLGSGWMQEEFDAAGVPMVGRTQRMEDALGACRALWTGTAASFTSETVSFRDVWCQPAPHRAGGPMVYLGGPATVVASERTARLADGWHPMSKQRDAIPEGIGLLRSAFAQAGRDPDGLPVRYLAIRPFTERSAAAACELRSELAELIKLGVTEVTLYVPGYSRDASDVPAALAWLAGVVADELTPA